MDPDSEIHNNFRIDMNLLSVDRESPIINSAKKATKVCRGRYRVAVKQLLEGSTAVPTPEAMQMFRRQIAVLPIVNHENVVKFVGASFQNMTLIAEFMMRGSLKNLLTKRQPEHMLDLQTVVGFALDTAQAMKYLHANNMTHRDLQASNLLLSVDGKHLKLANFGLDEKVPGAQSIRNDVQSFGRVLFDMIPNCVELIVKYQLRSQPAYDAYTMALLKANSGNLISFASSCMSANSDGEPDFTKIIAFLSRLSDELQAAMHGE
ncbi:hypothetical protein Sjap_010427 [Stephania japonica]|uniref:Protein kinase domain-containing protein n=1 Tax=Stephania japonica TaxID=461633 RepID=A0AAP0P6E2_9MAGN